jgi:outer membrane protein
MFKVISLLALPAVLAAQQVPASGVTPAVQPISLQQAVELAQQNNPAMVQSRGQVRTSDYTLKAGYAAFLPSLTASLSQRASGGQVQNPNGELTPIKSSKSYGTGLSTSLTLFDGGRRFYEIDQDKANIGAAEAGVVTQSFNVSLQVKTQYNAVLAARESEAAAQAALKEADEQLQAAVARVAAGAATMSDSLRAVVQVGNAQIQLLTAQNNEQAASAALTRLVGASHPVTADPSDTLDNVVQAPDSAMLASLAAQGPAVRQAQAQLSAAAAGIKSAKAAYFPTINLTYNYSGNGTDQFYGVGSGQLAYNHALGISLNLPVFNQLARENSVVAAEVSADNARASLRDAQLNSQATLVSWIGQYQTAGKRIQIDQVSIAAAEEDLRVQQQRYQLGASTLLEVLTSESALNTARLQLIQDRQSHRLARAQIEAIIGRDLQ